MSEDSDRIKKLLELRDFLKKRIDKLEREILRLRGMMEALDQTLLEQTLITADQLRSRKEVEKKEAFEERVISLEDGTPMGTVRIDRASNTITFIPTESIAVDAKERPISSFLIRKIREYGGRYEIDEYPDGRLKSIRIELPDPSNIERVFRALRWAVLKSIVH